MKKLLLVILTAVFAFVMLSVSNSEGAVRSFVSPAIWTSSYTIAGSGMLRIADAKYFHGVIVSSVASTASNGYIEFYDNEVSSASRQIGYIDTDVAGSWFYDVVLSSGLCINFLRNSSPITILYMKDNW